MILVEAYKMTNVGKENYIVWIDREMTGLDPEIDELVEIAVIVTNENLEPLDEGIELVIKPSLQAYENMNDFVTNMHKQSGLLADLPHGISIEMAREQVLAYVKRIVPTEKVALIGGNSVATDKRFLEKYMPQLVDYLHYRIIDVSTIKEITKNWYPRVYFQAPKKQGNHRALGDIKDSILELEYYRQTLFPAGEGPSTDSCQKISQSIIAGK